MFKTKATRLRHVTKSDFDSLGIFFQLGYRPRAKHRYVVVCYELDYEMRFDTRTEAEAYFSEATYKTRARGPQEEI